MSISGRTRTPSDIKWLLTEGAYLAGEVQQLSEQRQLLGKKLAYYTRLRERLVLLLQQTERAYTAKVQAQAALEHSLSVAAPGVSIASAKPLVLKRNWFGRLGALREFLEEQLCQSYPAQLTTAELVDRALQHFGIEVYAPEVRTVVRRTIASTLLRMSKHGVLESVASSEIGGSTLWRWRDGSVLTLMELMALKGQSDKAPNADDESANSNATRHQVACQ